MARFEKDHIEAIRRPSDRIASWFDWTTPNLVTLAGLVLAFPMIWAFYAGHTMLGLILFGFSAFTDGLDGAMARYQEAHMSEFERHQQRRKHILFRRGQTSGGFLSGASLDPFVDKLRFFGAAVPLRWSLWSPWLILPAAIFAGVLTAGRIYVERLKRKGRLRQDYQPKANMYGKYKAWAEIGFVLLIGLTVCGVPRLVIPTYVLLGVATVLGALSCYGQIYSLRKALKRKNAS